MLYPGRRHNGPFLRSLRGYQRQIIKAHTVDQTFGIYQTKETRLSLPGCGRGVTVPISIDPNPSRLTRQCTPRLYQDRLPDQRIFKRQAHAVNRFRRHFLPPSASNGVPVIRRNC